VELGGESYKLGVQNPLPPLAPPLFSIDRDLDLDDNCQSPVDIAAMGICYTAVSVFCMLEKEDTTNDTLEF